MTSSKQPKQKKVKAYALINKFEGTLVYGTSCSDKNCAEKERYEAVFATLKEARKAKKEHKEFYRADKICAVEITLNPKKNE